MWFEGEMSVMKKLPVDSSTAVPTDKYSTTGLGFTATTDGDKMKDIGFGYKDDNNYYKLLSTTERANAKLNGTNTNTDDDDYSEVKSVQAGGYLVSAPNGAVWTYTTEQQTEITNKYGEKQVVAAGSVIGSKNTTSGTSAELNVEANCVIDADTFTPLTPGLYIFRRNVELGTANTADTYEYSGYVFDGTNFFALCNDTAGNSDYTLPVGAVTVGTKTSPQAEPLTYTLDMDKIKLYTASETVVENSTLKWTYDNSTAGSEKLTASYNGGTAGDTKDDIVIDIALANIGTTGETWTAITKTWGTGADAYIKATFYYTNDLEEGDTTARLVDSVTLSSDTKKEAYLAFDFDLNVLLESVQVTVGENGNEMTTPVEAGGEFATASANGVGAHAAAQDTPEIADIEWTVD